MEKPVLQLNKINKGSISSSIVILLVENLLQCLAYPYYSIIKDYRHSLFDCHFLQQGDIHDAKKSMLHANECIFNGTCCMKFR